MKDQIRKIIQECLDKEINGDKDDLSKHLFPVSEEKGEESSESEKEPSDEEGEEEDWFKPEGELTIVVPEDGEEGDEEGIAKKIAEAFTSKKKK